MNDARADTLPERTAYLVMLGVGPAIWMLHFLMSYATAAVWCAKVAGPGGPLDGVRAAIASYTVVAVLLDVNDLVTLGVGVPVAISVGLAVLRMIHRAQFAELVHIVSRVLGRAGPRKIAPVQSAGGLS